MAKSLTDVAKAILMKEEAANASTLKPGSKSADPAQTLDLLLSLLILLFSQMALTVAILVPQLLRL